MALHAVPVTRSLLLAALAALMLSACAPRAAAVRLPPQSNAADHTCEIQNCGVNGKCVKDSAGAASCVCDTGFALLLDGRTCTDTCEIQNCGVNGKCVKDSDGAASCVYDTGFALQSDNRTGSTFHYSLCSQGPIDISFLAQSGVSEIKNCGANSVCNAVGNEATCVCDQGFVLQQDGVTCNPPLKTDLDTNVDPAPAPHLSLVDDATSKSPCPLSCANGHCDYTSNGMPTCVCDPGFVLQPDGTTCLQTVGG
ncbi:unnamed protein product [Closterium sp. NIES-64]|nr:unnamed protein product [Closterium sp. NIES-64]